MRELMRDVSLEPMELRQVRFLLNTPEIRDAALSLSQELISFIVLRFAS